MDLFNLTCGIMTFFLSHLVLQIEIDATAFDLPFHRRLSTASLKQIFNVQSYEEVPEYEVIQLRILSKRSVDDQDVIIVHLSAFGREIRLSLQRNEVFSNKLNSMKMYEANFDESGNMRLTEIILEDPDLGIPYIDPIQMAAITISHGLDGKLKMEGVIGDDLFITPAPTDINFLSDYITNGCKFTNENRSDFSEHSSSAGSYVHIVHMNLTKSKKLSKKFLPLYDVLNFNATTMNGTDRRRAIFPLHAWVEVLLMVDYDTYIMHKSFGYNETQIKRYYVSFLNGVDLRFKILSDPKVSLVLSQIIIFKSRDATPFIANNQFPITDRFNAHGAIADFSRHLYDAKLRKSLHTDFDVALLMTNLDMCTKEEFFCNRNTVGVAYFKGACCIIEKEKRWMGVAIVEDQGGFDGILTAAHEIGHLLGADHDGTQGASSCSHEEGYLMSHKVTSDRIFHWSECTIKQFRYFLNSDQVSCLFNEPSNNNELAESQLPGAMLSLDEQCKRTYGTRACAWDSRVCMSLRCYTDDEPQLCLEGLPPAAEGSSCGKDLHCQHGKCVSKSLIYSPAWNMFSVRDAWKYRNSQRFKTTTDHPPEEGCVDAEFCEYYFLKVGCREACKNSRIIEECCYSQKLLCLTKSL